MIPTSNDIRVEVSTKCNYNCVICPHARLTRKMETMSTDLFVRLLDKISAETDQYDTVTIPGMGEPLLDETLAEKVKAIRSRGLKALLLTNGSLLTLDRFRELEDAGANSIRVSIYGTTPETYAAIHGVDGAFLARIRDSLVKICDTRTTCEILLTYNVVTGVNDKVLDDWIAFWKDRADLLEVWTPHNWVDGASFREVQKSRKKTCGRPFSGPLQVQVDGTVNMCCFDYDGKLLLGDLKTQSLEEIFSSEMFRKIERCHTTGDYAGSDLICENCDQRNADKTGVMLYNSKYDIDERVKQTSSTYQDIEAGSRSEGDDG